MTNFSAIGEEVQESTALALATALPGGRLKELVGRHTGRGADYVRECCKTGRRYAPLDVLQVALDLTRDPALINLMSTRCYELVPRTPDPAGLKPVRDELLDISSALGRAVSHWQADMADGRVDDLHEHERLLGDVLVQAHEALAAVRRKAERQRGDRR